MKTVDRGDGRIQIVTDEEAAHLVRTSPAKYVSSENIRKKEKPKDE